MTVLQTATNVFHTFTAEILSLTVLTSRVHKKLGLLKVEKIRPSTVIRKSAAPLLPDLVTAYSLIQF